jgi:hypothetical protein
MKFEVNYGKNIYTFNAVNPVKIRDIVQFFRNKFMIPINKNLYIYDDNKFYSDDEHICENVKFLYTALSYPQSLFSLPEEVNDKTMEEIIMEATCAEHPLQTFKPEQHKKRRLFAVECMDRRMVFELVEYDMEYYVEYDEPDSYYS